MRADLFEKPEFKIQNRAILRAGSFSDSTQARQAIRHSEFEILPFKMTF